MSGTGRSGFRTPFSGPPRWPCSKRLLPHRSIVIITGQRDAMALLSPANRLLLLPLPRGQVLGGENYPHNFPG